jgi:SepF-like predicted cell division protein (DUF552 family)
MPFNLFHKKKQAEQESPATPPQEQTQPEAPEQPQEVSQEPNSTTQETMEQTPVATQEQTQENVEPDQKQPEQETPQTNEQTPSTPEPPTKTYLKAMPLRELSDLDSIKAEVKNGNIIILRVTPLAGKSIEDVKTAVNDLFQFAESIDGDIARLGEERVVITPKTVRIWREKTPAPVSSSNESLPAAA